MKKLHFMLALVIGLFLFSCSGSSSSDSNEAAPTELSLGVKESGTIATLGDVDWYHYRAVEANNILQVNCSSNTFRPDVDLLVTAYEEDENGNKIRLHATHAPEGSQLPADLKMNVYIDVPKDIYIAVRDLMDDESSNNRYYVSVDFTNSPEGNGNFAQATPLIVDNADTCQMDNIGYIGDVDCYQFEAPADGVYAVKVDFLPFSGGTDVELAIDLYDSEGILVESLARPQGFNYHLVPYLASGQYYVMIDDYGKNDFDTSSSYQICVESVATDEKNENDVLENASEMTYDSSSHTYSGGGSLDYWGDKDWYKFPLDTIDSEGFKVLQIRFDDGEESNAVKYQINIEDSTNHLILSHEYSGGSTEYQTQIKAGQGDHFLMIQASPGQTIPHKVPYSAPYTVSIEVLDIVDPAEIVAKELEGGEIATGNDTINTAVELTPVSDPSGFTTGKIGYRGDEDWYRLQIPDTTRPQVLEVFLDTDNSPSLVEYYLSIMRDTVIKKIYDSNGEDGGTELKTSILLPAIDSPTPVNYFFRVCDYQGDDGDGLVPYRIRVNLREIPSALPVDSTINPADVIYHGEIAEMGDPSATPVRLEHNSLVQKTYPAENTFLKFNVPNPANGITKTKNTDQTTSINIPWIAGYIDFQGDQDWFELELGPLAEEGGTPDSKWYYEIKIDLHVDAPGSSVEYIWKLYRDSNDNQILVDRAGDSNGFFASAGDPDTVTQALDISIPVAGSDQEFWVGDAWQGKFYLSISDFNFIGADHPDDDWGYEGVPYYFKVSLVYHPGVSYPE